MVLPDPFAETEGKPRFLMRSSRLLRGSRRAYDKVLQQGQSVLGIELYPLERGFLPSALRATTKSKSERRLITSRAPG